MTRLTAIGLLLLGAGAIASCAGQRPLPRSDVGSGMALVPIRAGTFLMGSAEGEALRKADEGPQTTVTITRDFMMGATEVTVAEYRAFADAAGYRTVAERDGWSHDYTEDGIAEVPGRSWRDPGFPQGEDHPVVCIHWDDIVAYCAWKSTALDRTVRLPTEAEWEYACRAGTTTAYWWGDDIAGGEGKANLADASAARAIPAWNPPDVPWDDGYVYTSPVATFAPNPWGLYDMHGNVWEWCSDIYGGPHPGGSVTDPAGAPEGDHHLRRGGSWYRGPGTARSANRGRSRNDFRVNNRGFRIVVEMPSAKDPKNP